MRKHLLIALLLTLAACSNSKHERASVSKSPSTEQQITLGTSKKFIRTEDAKMKVKDVIASSSFIEDIVKSHNGYVESSKMISQKSNEKETRFTRDSVQNSAVCSLSNDFVLRIPDSQLDSVSRILMEKAIYIDSHNSSCENVSFQSLKNNLDTDRFRKSLDRIDNLSGNAKNQSALNFAEAAGESMEAANTAVVNEMKLNDKVNFSSLHVVIYQDPFFISEKHVSFTPLPEYTVSFADQIMNAFADGWKIIEFLVVLICKLWSLIFFAISGIYIYKKTGMSLLKKSS